MKEVSGLDEAKAKQFANKINNPLYRSPRPPRRPGG
jgi:hypothetical protein